VKAGFYQSLFLFVVLASGVTRGTAQSDPVIPKNSALIMSPAKLDFGTQPVGTTSQPKTATLANTGTSTVTIRDVLPSGIDFAQTNTCRGDLAPGANCAIEVRFTPAITGPRFGSVMILDSDPGSPHTLDLSGTGQ